MASDEENLVGTKVGKKFVIEKYLAKGSFGKLYIGKNSESGEKVAIKLEKKDIDKPQLGFEFAFFRILRAEGRQHRGIPTIHFFGPVGKWSALIMDLLGPSLEKVHTDLNFQFSLKTTILLGVQLIELFEYFHGKTLVYRDVKPENFLFGVSGTDKYSTIHIIDLGLCKQYIDDETNKHIKFATNKMMTGTVRYMSINSHNRLELSRRDDMEAVGYMLVFFVKGELPWQGVKASSTAEKYAIIGQIKEKTKPEKLCSDLPQEFAQYMKDVRGLAFEEEPKYKTYTQRFTNLFLKNGFKNDGVYDFDKNHRPRKK